MDKTCAACDYPLDASAIEVRIGNQVVEVCCEDCARKIGESTAGSRQAAGEAPVRA